MNPIRFVLLVSFIFFNKNADATPSATKDTGDCKKVILFKNSTRVPHDVQVYDEKFNPDSWKGPRPKFEFTLEPGKSRKIKALPKTTYYYMAVSNGEMSTPDMHRNIKGEIDAEECKTETEEFE